MRARKSLEKFQGRTARYSRPRESGLSSLPLPPSAVALDKQADPRWLKLRQFVASGQVGRAAPGHQPGDEVARPFRCRSRSSWRRSGKLEVTLRRAGHENVARRSAHDRLRHAAYEEVRDA